MPSTYDLLQSASRLLATSGDYEPDEFEAVLADWVGEGEDKLARLAAWSRANEAEEKRNKEQRDAYDRAIARNKREQGRAKEYAEMLLLAIEEATGTPKAPGVARLQNNGGKPPLLGLDKIDPATLPDDLVIVLRIANPDAIRDALEAGREVPGAAIGARGRHVRFE